MLNPARPFFYLLAYLAVLYLRPQEYVPSLIGTALVPASLLFAVALWLIAQPKNFEAPQHGLMLALAAAMGLSVLASGWMMGAIKVVTQFVPTLLVFYLVATSVDSLKRFREICLVLSLLSAVMALHGIEQAAQEGGIGWTGAEMIQGRITYLGFLNDPNDLAMAFLISLPLTLYLARVTDSFWLRHAAHAAAALTAYGIYLCNSRGSMLGLGAMLACWVSRRYGTLRGLLVLPVLLLGLLLLGPSRINEMAVDEESAAGRIDAWYAGFEMFREHPLLGVGSGQFTDYNPLTAHNSFVLALAEMGLLGYGIWMAILLVSAAMLWQVLTLAPLHVAVPLPAADAAAGEEPAPPEPLPLWSDVQRAGAALAYAFIGALVSAFFLSRSYVVFLYLLVALVVALHQLARRHWPELAPVRLGAMAGRLVMTPLVSIAALWLLTRILLNFA